MRQYLSRERYPVALARRAVRRDDSWAAVAMRGMFDVSDRLRQTLSHRESLLVIPTQEELDKYGGDQACSGHDPTDG